MVAALLMFSALSVVGIILCIEHFRKSATEVSAAGSSPIPTGQVIKPAKQIREKDKGGLQQAATPAIFRPQPGTECLAELPKTPGVWELLGLRQRDESYLAVLNSPRASLDAEKLNKYMAAKDVVGVSEVLKEGSFAWSSWERVEVLVIATDDPSPGMSRVRLRRSVIRPATELEMSLAKMEDKTGKRRSNPRGMFPISGRLEWDADLVRIRDAEIILETTQLRPAP
jgi:hypothetical protein